MTLQEAVTKFQKAAAKDAAPYSVHYSNYYCGITNDLDRRRGEHKTPAYLYTCTCPSFEIARKLEQMLHDAGFDTGEQVGNGNEDSVNVYMYRKIPRVTCESLTI